MASGVSDSDAIKRAGQPGAQSRNWRPFPMACCLPNSPPPRGRHGAAVARFENADLSLR